MAKFQHYIVVPDSDIKTVEGLLNQWIKLYNPSVHHDVDFDLYKTKEGEVLVVVDDRLDNQRFSYLLNYLAYPHGCPENKKVYGYDKVLGQDWHSWVHVGKIVQLYIHPDDEDYLNVHLIAPDNTNYRLDFFVNEEQTERCTAISYDRNYIDPVHVPKRRQKVKTIQMKFDPEFQVDDFGDLFDSRKVLRRLTGLVLICFLLSILFLVDEQVGTVAGVLVPLGFWGYVSFEHRLFQTAKNYLWVFSLALGIFIFGFFVMDIALAQKIPDIHLVFFGTPLIGVLIQLPLRLIFIKIFRREPNTSDSNGGWDGLYSAILSAAPILISFYLLSVV